MAIIKEQGGDYGLQKLFGTAGAVAFGPIAGLLVDAEESGGKRGGDDYTAVIVIYFCLRAASAAAILGLGLVRNFLKKRYYCFLLRQ